MNATGYKAIGYVVWNGGKWYARRRLPSRRVIAIGAAGGLSALLGAALLARRLAS